MKFGSVLILAMIVCALLLMPTCVSAQWGSSGTKLVASGSAGNTVVSQRAFFVYQPVQVRQTTTVTTTTKQVQCSDCIAIAAIAIPTCKVRARAERAPLLVSPRLQRAIARRAARTERAAAQTLAKLDPDDC